MAVEGINQKLCELCKVENPDFEAIEDLLKAGADPMGLIDNHGTGEVYLYSLVIGHWMEVAHRKIIKVFLICPGLNQA